MELEAQRKDKEGKKEEVTEELKRFTLQGIAGEFSVFEEALLIFEPQDPNVDWYTKVAAAIHYVGYCCLVIYDKKKRAATQTSLNPFLKRVDRTAGVPLLNDTFLFNLTVLSTLLNVTVC